MHSLVVGPRLSTAPLEAIGAGAELRLFGARLLGIALLREVAHEIGEPRALLLEPPVAT